MYLINTQQYFDIRCGVFKNEENECAGIGKIIRHAERCNWQS
jgi:hypothetical protein